MTFPKAQKGIKRIYIAQFFLLSGSILLVLLALSNMLLHAMYKIQPTDSVLTMVSSVIYIVSVVSMLTGILLNIIGIINASGDDENFKVALYSLGFEFIFSVVGFILTSDSVIGSITSLLTTLTSFLIIIYIIEGIRNLAQKLNQSKIDHRGNLLYTLFSVFYVLETCANVAVLVFSDTEAMVVVYIIQVGINLISVVQSLLFVLYLGKAKKMLTDH